MGIDVYLYWDGMDKEKESKNRPWCDATVGHTGYLREAYHGGPYATKILVREAFEAENCEAEIPAAVMRERLTRVTEPARGCDTGHNVAAMVSHLMRQAHKHDDEVHVTPFDIQSGETTPMSVEEAVRTRFRTIYPDAGPEHVEEVVRSFQNFVALAEEKEAETGKPCTVYASY
jgi:hypothetical protein